MKEGRRPLEVKHALCPGRPIIVYVNGKELERLTEEEALELAKLLQHEAGKKDG